MQDQNNEAIAAVFSGNSWGNCGMKHIVIIGFKSVGKSSVGKALAQQLNRPFFDLDAFIEFDYREKYQQALTFREILAKHGEKFFREMETSALQRCLKQQPAAVIALGGGAAMLEENQQLIQSHWVVHIVAQKDVVFNRMMKLGVPAFFPKGQDPAQFFQQLWSQRIEMYDTLSDVTADNTFAVEDAVEDILKEWEKAK